MTRRLGSEDFSGHLSTNDLDRYADFIVTALHTAVDKAIPKSKSVRPESNPISNETLALIKEKRKLRRQYSQMKDPAVKTRINQLQKQVKDDLRVESQASWEKFCNSISLEADSNESWRKRLSQSIMESFNRGEHVVAAFLDVEKAFDNVWHNGLRYKIFQLGLPTKMTRWLSDFLVGRLIQVNVNSFLSNQINPNAGVPQGSLLSPLLFLIYVNDLPPPHHKQNSLSQFADDTAQWAFSLNVKFAANLLQQDLLKLATWCAKWRIKLNPKKTKVIIFSRSLLARKAELNLTLYGEPLKSYPQVKFLGIIFDSKLTFQKHFEDVLERCNHRYHRLRLLANKKWGPSPATLTQIYKQCVRPIFEYGSLSTITASDNIISKIQRLQNKFIRLALRLPKYIIPRLLHDSTGLPYVKDRLLTCATKSLDRIAQNPLVEASISSHRHNPGLDRFPTPLSVVRPGDS